MIYLELLWRWSARLNLTGARGPETQVQVLVAPVLPLRPLLEAPILDIGSGNGSPGLVLALLEPSLATTLLEPRAKRWAFLREAARRCGRGDLAILKERHDQYRGPAARTVLLRALKLPAEAIQPLVAHGGQLLALGQSPSLGEGFAAEPAPFEGSRWRRTD